MDSTAMNRSEKADSFGQLRGRFCDGRHADLYVSQDYTPKEQGQDLLIGD
jgi:hypothetical protein